MSKQLLLMLVCMSIYSFTFAQFRSISAKEVATLSEQRRIIPQKYSLYKVNFQTLRQQLAQAPSEGAAATFTMELPMPDGSTAAFYIYNSPIMDAALAAQLPDIQTFAAISTKNQGINGRLDITPFGFHAMLFTPEGVIFIDPYAHLNTEFYQAYYKKDYSLPQHKLICEAHEEGLLDDPHGLHDNTVQDRSPLTLTCGGSVVPRTYRIAVACTGEYAVAATGLASPTQAQTMAAITTSINRVSGVYQREFGAQFTFATNQLNVVYTNATTDPFTGNNNANTLINESQTVIDGNVGTANYDIGHTFSTGGGGLATLSCVCTAGSKARGITGSASPVGDTYDIDYVAHEVGHQFGGSHTFNGDAGNCSGNRSATSAYEVGSGSTIQAYAGICGPIGNQSIQPYSDDYFHIRSLEQMMTYMQGGGNCSANAASTNNAPQITSPATSTTFTIPRSTPFSLTGAATDANGDALTYCWEEWDLGTAGQINASSTTAPIFRSFDPTSSPTRYFPALSDVLGGVTTYGEVLPAVARTLNFKLTVRDNRLNAAGGGGFCRQQYSITVANAGPFDVTSQATAQTWAIGSTQTITWSVGGTTAAPISCANVDILLSTDGGLTFPTTLASGVPNDGTHPITVPNVTTATGRIKVVCSNNIFYDVNVANILINAAVTTNCTSYTNSTPVTISTTGTPTITSTITVPSTVTGTINDINIPNLTIAHTYTSDLTIRLTSPAGTTVTLVQGICTSNDNFNLGFDSQSANTTIPCPPTTGLLYTPAAALSAFNGQSAAGNWILTVIDGADQDGGSLNSWQLQVCTQVVTSLPVEFVSLKAKPRLKDIELQWETAAELLLQGYEIWRSAEAIGDFEKIGYVAAQGNAFGKSQYNFVDEHVVAGNTYYYKLKLKHTSEGEVDQFSHIVTTQLGEKAAMVSIAPNPAAQTATLYLSQAAAQVSLQLYDLTGKLVQTYASPTDSYLTTLPIDVSNLPKGMYMAKVTIDNLTEVVKLQVAHE